MSIGAEGHRLLAFERGCGESGIDVRRVQGFTGHAVVPVALSNVQVRPLASVDVERPDELARRQAHARQRLQSTEWGRGSSARSRNTTSSILQWWAGSAASRNREPTSERGHPRSAPRVSARGMRRSGKPRSRETRAAGAAATAATGDSGRRRGTPEAVDPAGEDREAGRRGSPPCRRPGRGTATTRHGHRGPYPAPVSLAVSVTGLVHRVYFDRSELPELGPFVLFQPPTTGEVTDARGEVVIQLAREYRRPVTYDEVPHVVRHAILAAEDRNFLDHSGVDYGALPRVMQKTAARTLSEWRNGSGLRLDSRRAARPSRSSSCGSTSCGT